jgi:tRNA(Glu) U13 pseudouridine synthase TruD
VTVQTFAAGGRETEGTRRFFRVPLTGLEVETLPERALRLRFVLPAGAYATVLLREVLKGGAGELPGTHEL